MTGIGTLVDLLLFYTLERLLFNRMVRQMGKNPHLVKMAIAFWLVLQETGCYDLTRIINSSDDSTVESMFNEALLCLNFIQSSAVEPIGATDTLDRRFMYRRVMHIMETVCDKIFGDNEAIEVDERRMRPVARPFGAAGMSSGNRGGEVLRQSTLNPNASEFVPAQINSDARTMFFTFSKGLPLTREEIINFFTLKWGNVVQDVVIEEVGGGEAPLYGRITFTTYSIIPVILNGQPRAKFMVGRKHLWARIYVPRRR